MAVDPSTVTEAGTAVRSRINYYVTYNEK